MAKHDDTVERNGTAGATFFPSADEARSAGKPEKHPKWKLWQVTDPKGGVRFLWADGLGHALRLISQADGYSALSLDRKPANPALVAGMLAALSPDDRTALLAQYLPSGKKAGK